MDIATINYLEQQFFQVAPLPLEEANFPNGIDLKLSSTFGESHYLRITPDQLRKIEQVLLGVI
jgi:hypothetical protein